MNFFDKLFKKKTQRNIHLGRNENCWCGSGLKYKRCHMEKDELFRGREREEMTISKSGGGMF